MKIERDEEVTGLADLAETCDVMTPSCTCTHRGNGNTNIASKTRTLFHFGSFKPFASKHASKHASKQAPMNQLIGNFVVG